MDSIFSCFEAIKSFFISPTPPIPTNSPQNPFYQTPNPSQPSTNNNLTHRGSNIRSLQRGDSNEDEKDNAYWNGNSTQFK